ncbi:MAG: alginate export family protein [Bacteroidota bacterium]
MKKATILLVLLVTNFPLLWAQLTISADISPRAELRHGYRVLPMEGEKAAALVSQRTRLILSWSMENLRTHISFHDFRVWGQEAQRQFNPSLAIHEAWAELDLSREISLKAGRQELKYDNQRFFAFNDWLPMGQKHDVLLIKYTLPDMSFHFGSAFNQPSIAYQRNFTMEYGINNYKYMNFAWFNTTLNDSGKLSVLAVADGYEFSDGTQFDPEVLYVRGTWSALLRQEAGEFSLMINPALQHGRNRSGQSIRAWYFRGEATRSTLENTNSTLGLEIFSGNNTASEHYGTFDPLYGAGHANNGFMDYFTLIPQHTSNAGLINPFLKNRTQISGKAQFGAALHLFFIQSTYMYENEALPKYLGTEIDLTLTYRFNPSVRIIGGLSWMFASESMEIINRGSQIGSSDEPAYFAYVMMRIRPKLFEQ